VLCAENGDDGGGEVGEGIHDGGAGGAEGGDFAGVGAAVALDDGPGVREAGAGGGGLAADVGGYWLGDSRRGDEVGEFLFLGAAADHADDGLAGRGDSQRVGAEEVGVAGFGRFGDRHGVPHGDAVSHEHDKFDAGVDGVEGGVADSNGGDEEDRDIDSAGFLE